MKTATYIFLAVAAIILVAAGCAKTDTNKNNPVVNAADNTNGSASAATVQITADGFAPSTVAINAGETVTWVNETSSQHWPASDPHPVHTGLPGFDALPGLSNGETYSFTFTDSGTFGYHDHLNSSLTGKVIVK